MVLRDRVEGHRSKVRPGGRDSSARPVAESREAARRELLGFLNDRYTAAILGYLIKSAKRMATPTTRSRTAQNSAYERATTLFRA
jgi:hypothetical protein